MNDNRSAPRGPDPAADSPADHAPQDRVPGEGDDLGKAYANGETCQYHRVFTTDSDAAASGRRPGTPGPAMSHSGRKLGIVLPLCGGKRAEATDLYMRFAPMHRRFAARYGGLVPEADWLVPFHHGFTRLLPRFAVNEITVDEFAMALSYPGRFLVDFLRAEGRRGRWTSVPIEGVERESEDADLESAVIAKQRCEHVRAQLLGLCDQKGRLGEAARLCAKWLDPIVGKYAERFDAVVVVHDLASSLGVSRTRAWHLWADLATHIRLATLAPR